MLTLLFGTQKPQGKSKFLHSLASSWRKYTNLQRNNALALISHFSLDDFFSCAQVLWACTQDKGFDVQIFLCFSWHRGCRNCVAFSDNGSVYKTNMNLPFQCLANARVHMEERYRVTKEIKGLVWKGLNWKLKIITAFLKLSDRKIPAQRMSLSVSQIFQLSSSSACHS